MDGYAVAVWTLFLGILSLIAHVVVFPWIYAQRRAGVERTKAVVRDLLSDPETAKSLGAAVAAALPKLDSMTASSMAERRWAVQAEKDSRIAQTRATILTLLAERVGEIWAGMIWKFIEANDLVPDSVLLSNQWRPIVEKVISAYEPKIRAQQAVKAGSNDVAAASVPDAYLPPHMRR